MHAVRVEAALQTKIVLLRAVNVAGTGNPSCNGYLCTGQSGYDGPTGLGTPNGVSGF